MINGLAMKEIFKKTKNKVLLFLFFFRKKKYDFFISKDGGHYTYLMEKNSQEDL